MNKLQQLRKDARDLLFAATDTSVTNFSDVNTSARNAFKEYFMEISGGDDSIRALSKHSMEMFAIIEEVLDEVVPQRVEDRIGDFAEVKQFARDAQVEFKIPTTYASRRRLYTAIKKGARGGVYRAYRVDGTVLDMSTYVESVGYRVTLEELLSGNRTISELTSILADAWVEKIYVLVMDQLATAALAAPDANKASGAFVEASLDTVIETVSGYGTPVIFAKRREATKLGNLTALDGGTDGDDIRNYGYVQLYKGTRVVLLPNYLITNVGSNTEWLFTDKMLYVLPGDIKPVKVAFKGESKTKEIENADGSSEYHNHRLMGTTVLFNANIGSFNLNA